MQKINILGCGQVLMGDDAVGCLIAQKLRSMDLPGHVSVREAGTPGLDILNMMKPGERVIIVDAVVTGEHEPGTLTIFSEKEIPDPSRMPTSGHLVAIPEAIALGRKVQPELMPDSIELWGIEIKIPLVRSREVSEEIEKSIPLVIDKLLEEWQT